MKVTSKKKFHKLVLLINFYQSFNCLFYIYSREDHRKNCNYDVNKYETLVYSTFYFSYVLYTHYIHIHLLLIFLHSARIRTLNTEPTFFVLLRYCNNGL